MSLILDALKKLEQEKASFRNGPVDIVPEIINSRNNRARSGRWKIPAVLIGVAALTAAATMVIMVAFASNDKRTVPVISGNVESVQPITQFSAIRGEVGEKGLSEGNANHQVAGEVQDAAASRAPSSLRKDTVSPFPSRESKTHMDKNDDVVRDAGVPFPVLKVSGIAWQEDKADRRAVVNGALAGEGAVIEGARIVRIYQDRVRFSFSGQTYDIAVTGPLQGK